MRKFTAVAFAGALLAAGALPIVSASAQSGTQTNNGPARPDAHSGQGGGTGAASEEATTPAKSMGGAGASTTAAPTMTDSGTARPDTMKSKKKMAHKSKSSKKGSQANVGN